MKRAISFILAFVMCMSLVACGGDTKTSNSEPQTGESAAQQETEQSNTNENENIDTNEKSEFEREVTEEGYVVISKEEFASYLTKIELTTENWKEYLDIIEVTEEERNGFGEIVSSETSMECTAKNVLGCYFDDVAINFKVISTGETLYCEDVFYRLHNVNSKINWENYTIDDLTCEKIVGDLIILDNVPDECISTYEDGGKFICVGSADDYMTMDFNDLEGMSMNISLAYAFYK